jgi:hypothetical protein
MPGPSSVQFPGARSLLGQPLVMEDAHDMHVRHGQFQDWELMSILRDEWLAQERPRSWQID